MKHKKPLIYLASPYTHPDPKVMGARYVQMRNLVATLLNEQDAIIPYSPIVHTHPIHFYVDDDFDWVKWDLHFLARCDGMIVNQMQGWSASKGIQHEMRYCRDNNIPFTYATHDQIVETCRSIEEAIAIEDFLSAFDASERIDYKHADGTRSTQLTDIKP